MKQVVMFQANDGRSFEDAAACIAHETRVNIINEAESNSFNLNQFGTDENDNDVLRPIDIPSFIADNFVLLQRILKTAVPVVETRGRKSKVAVAQVAQ